MILLLLGWNLSLLGVVSLLLAVMTGSFAAAVFGAVVGVPGIVMSLALRKTCSSYRSGIPEEPDPNRPLDYY
jgi:uncharacterized membrane protein YuzA (DUF378 family)